MSASLPNKPYQAKVHVWDTKVGNEEGEGSTVGHASIELQGESNGRYFSFRPRYSSLVNPFLSFLPTLGKSESSLSSDLDLEGKLPDRTYQMELTQVQHDAMASEVDLLTKKAEEGKLLYHLFPNFSILKPVKMLATKTGQEEMGRCPFSGHKMGDERYKDFAEIQDIEEGHCATTVHQIVSRAFDLPPTSPTPWKIHPTLLSHYISRVVESEI